MISKEKVDHIAKLARLNVKEEEYSKYQSQLNDILTEIDKIMEVNVTSDEIMISPTTNTNCYSEDVIENHISKEDLLKNAKSVKGDYVTVPKVIE